MRRRPRALPRPVRGMAVLVAIAAPGACGSDAQHVVAAGQSVAPSAAPTGPPTKPAPTPVDRSGYLRTAPPGQHPDPCGVASAWDTIPSHDPGRIPASQPADRVHRAAKKLFPGRFLEVYIDDVPRQYGVGVMLYRLTPADEDRFFAATCFHRGDVVFVDGPVSPAQFKQWQRALMVLWRREPGVCESDEDRRAGLVHVTIQPGHPHLRHDVETTIPAAHLKLQEGGCPVPL